MPLTKGAKGQEAIQELNHHARFGRMSLAFEHVADTERAAFAQRRKDWGARVHIADAEVIAGDSPSKDSMVSTVRVSWYQPEIAELHTTDILQKWKFDGGNWKLVGEELAGGAPGLFPDPQATGEKGKQAKAREGAEGAGDSVTGPMASPSPEGAAAREEGPVVRSRAGNKQFPTIRIPAE
jgi:hypothetical protein